ncbi:MAG: hypothetical protein HKL80_04845 [Acidimicrobiales bacterium]|nr:hypothetical protein [Acidimicrobiales bacterium]
MIAPAMLAMQIGSMVGHLAQTTFGAYDLPLPRVERKELIVVTSNVTTFANDWSLDLESVRLWVLTREMLMLVVFSSPHIDKSIRELISAHARGMKMDADEIASKLQNVDLTDPSALESAFGDPEAMFGGQQTLEQIWAAESISAGIAAIEGFIHYVGHSIIEKTLGNVSLLEESLIRRRVTRSEAVKYGETLFGLTLDQSNIEMGEKFISEVVDLAGLNALANLFNSENGLPLPSELESPELWLDRFKWTQMGGASAIASSGTPRSHSKVMSSRSASLITLSRFLRNCGS